MAGREQFYAPSETVFFGLSWDRKLVLAAPIGPAITFGVMGVINVPYLWRADL